MKKFLFLILLILPGFCFALDKIDINSASLAQLDELTGIGPVYAQRIIDGRPYSSVDDLLRVNGIGPATLQKIKDQGLACVNCLSQTITQPASLLNSATNPTTVYPTGIYINEILPSPEGPDETDELFELYNSNNFDVDLSGWKIKDQQGTITIFTIPDGTKIMANGFKVFARPETKIMLNNDSDGLIFLNPDGKLMDSTTFANAPTGQSYSKASGLWQWSIKPTFGSQNIISLVQPQVNNKALSNLQKSDNSSKVEDDGLGQLSQDSNQDKNINNPWFLFFIAIFLTIILSLLTLFIKFKLNKHVRT